MSAELLCAWGFFDASGHWQLPRHSLKRSRSRRACGGRSAPIRSKLHFGFIDHRGAWVSRLDFQSAGLVPRVAVREYAWTAPSTTSNERATSPSRRPARRANAFSGACAFSQHALLGHGQLRANHDSGSLSLCLGLFRWARGGAARPTLGLLDAKGNVPNCTEVRGRGLLRNGLAKVRLSSPKLHSSTRTVDCSALTRAWETSSTGFRSHFEGWLWASSDATGPWLFSHDSRSSSMILGGLVRRCRAGPAILRYIRHDGPMSSSRASSSRRGSNTGWHVSSGWRLQRCQEFGYIDHHGKFAGGRFPFLQPQALQAWAD